MSRYIDADKLQEAFKELHGGKRSLLIDTEPTADVRKNVRANLVLAGYKRDGSTQWLECSVCGGAVDFTDNFCKHCGAYFRRGTT